MKHLFLPLPIETVQPAWDNWCASNFHGTEEVRLLETSGGCVLVTNAPRPPRVFIDLLKDFLSQQSSRVAS